MPGQRKKYQTQWAAQFYAAAELSRRGHLVALTLGNAPRTDLLVVSPAGVNYHVEVKGLAAPNWWLIQPGEVQADLFYILVQVPPVPEPPRFFILSSAELAQEMAPVLAEMRLSGAAMSGAGIRWKQALGYQDRWETLPA